MFQHSMGHIFFLAFLKHSRYVRGVKFFLKFLAFSQFVHMAIYYDLLMQLVWEGMTACSPGHCFAHSFIIIKPCSFQELSQVGTTNKYFVLSSRWEISFWLLWELLWKLNVFPLYSCDPESTHAIWFVSCQVIVTGTVLQKNVTASSVCLELFKRS